MMNDTNDKTTMTLWDAYRLANRRRAAVRVTLLSGPVGTPSADVRVKPSLANGHVEMHVAGLADRFFCAASKAREVTVARR